MSGLPFGPAGETDGDERQLGPVEGWGALLLVLALQAIVALAIDDARWAGFGQDGGSATGFLLWASLLGGLWGFISAKTRLPAFAAHLVGAILAATFLIVAVAGVISRASALDDRVAALLLSLDRFYVDLVIEGIRSSQLSPFLLSIGAVVWATGQFSTFALFRRQRPLNAIFVSGLVLLTNMAVTIKIQYPFLVFFSAAAMLLLVRMNLLEQREGWLRRHIGDAGYVSGLYFRSGLVFVAVALLGSLVLTATASSAPLRSMWNDVDDQLLKWGQDLNYVVGGVTGPARGPSGLFGASQTIRGVWESSSAIVFRATTSDRQGRYWRGATYDLFDGSTWQQYERSAPARVEAGESILAETLDAVGQQGGRTEVTMEVTAIDLNTETLLAPDAPLTIDRPVSVFTHLPRGPLATIQSAEDLRNGETYTLTSLVRAEGERNGGLTANKLAAAGTSYPFWARRYISIKEGSIGDVTRQTATRIVAGLAGTQRDPYHITEAVQRYLYSDGGFAYQTDVRGLCGSQQVVDCFLTTKRGYCEYFATAMVMLLRTHEIPARIAMGYLPGRELEDGTFEVDRGAAHAWVEVYFPGYGWVPFDPTPGNQANGQAPTQLEPGAPVPTPTPVPGASGGVLPRPTFGGLDANDPGDDRDPVGGVGTLPDTPTTPPTGSPTPILIFVVAGLLLASVALVGWVRSQRAPAPPPEVAYRGVARLAGRFGYGPRPAQTAYEYAGVLGDLLPGVRTDLHTVAQAKVEASYGARLAEGDALLALRDAYRRIRLRLFRLALRRR
jgi:transglutaminase-like putative cysteine protease